MAPTPNYPQASVITPPLKEVVSAIEASITSAPVARGQRRTTIPIGLITVVAVVACAVAMYVVLKPSPTSQLAAALRSAVKNGRLVTLAPDDAYTYYFQLRGVNATHPVLHEIAPQVLPHLRSLGEAALHKKMSVQTAQDTLQEWTKTLYVFAWAHALEPGDPQLEARWRFAESEVAKGQGRKEEAERGYAAAAQLQSAWALPHNSLGLLRSEAKQYAEAIPHFQQAIQLQSEWEIPYSNLGTAYFYLKDYETAEHWYQTALQKNPQWARPHYWLGVIYEHNNRKEQAVEAYQQALSLGRDSLPVPPDDIQKRIARLQR